jgi:cytochrome c
MDLIKDGIPYLYVYHTDVRNCSLELNVYSTRRMKRLVPLLLAITAVACAKKQETPIGNADRGRELIATHGCNVCHAVPGIEGAQGSLGPTLAGIGSRPAISFGTVPNTPVNLAKFIQEPASLNPQSSMPAIGIPSADAQDIAAYLLTLK